jgi:hypothetical protein
MSFKVSAIAACAATVAIGLAVTHPLELRAWRWTRIGLSLPIVVLIVSIFCGLEGFRGYFAMWGFALLGFLWMEPMAYAATEGVQHIIFGDDTRASSGVRATFSGARALRRHGDLDEAIRLTEAELEKEPKSYEGLMLLSELFEETGEHGKAAAALEQLIDSGALTAEQRKCAQQRLGQLSSGARTRLILK